MKISSAIRNSLFAILFCLFPILIIRDFVVTIIILGFLFLFILVFFLPIIIDFFEKKKIKKLSSIDVSNYATYYRDIISKYSILELSMLDGYDIDFPKDIVACLLKLQLKKIIKIVNGKIDVLVNDFDGLKKSEKYILKSINDGKVKLKDDYYLRNCVKKECVDDKLIIKLKYFGDKLAVIAGILIFVFLSVFFLGTFISVNGDISTSVVSIFGEVLLLVVVFGFIFVLLFTTSVLSYGQFLYDKNRWKLSNEGRNIFGKLVGLKKFLVEFSAIDKRKVDELMIWDDYLIYSVMFGLNKEIIDKYKDLVLVRGESNK